jgi:cytochrome c oxidase subunit 2
MTGALDPAGVQAHAIAWLFTVFLAVCAIIWVLVMAVLFAAIRRHGRTAAAPPPPAHPSADAPVATELAIGGSLAVTTAILGAFLALSFSTGRALSSLDTADAVVVTVVGHQFWWEIRYEDPEPSRVVVTANELHVPVGRTVVVNATARDVIHSLWVPRLHGKVDLIPGHENHLAFRADVPGVFRGQCAEFCGFQHAHMAIHVIAEPPEAFTRWLDGQRAAGVTPTEAATSHGRRVFETRSCALCHTVRGADASGTVGPDLTHLASRTTLAAGTLPNTGRDLARWIVDPQAVKPGSNMPATALSGEDLAALVAYLETLT